MQLSPATVEAYLKRSFNRYTMKQVDKSIQEIDEFLRGVFKKFDFKVHGLRMTAVEFFEIQERLRISKKYLLKRRAEISKKRIQRF